MKSDESYDKFLINKLESVFNKIQISPYLIARLFLVGSLILLFLRDKTFIMNMNILALTNYFFMVCFVTYLYRNIHRVEAWNRMFMKNKYKKDHLFFRTMCICSVVTLLFYGHLLGVKEFTTAALEIFIVVIYEYLICLVYIRDITGEIEKRWNNPKPRWRSF